MQLYTHDTKFRSTSTGTSCHVYMYPGIVLNLILVAERNSILLGFSKTAFFDMGCVYIDPCSTILLRESNTHNFKNLAVGSTIFFIFFQFFEEKKSSILPRYLYTNSSSTAQNY